MELDKHKAMDWPIAQYEPVQRQALKPRGPAAAQDDASESFTIPRTKPKPFTRGTIYTLKGWQWLLFHPLSWLLSLYLKTIRFKISTEEKEYSQISDRPVLFIGWHNRSLVFYEMFRRFRDPSKAFCLISPSKMAAWEDAFYRKIGLNSIRGSSSRRGIAALREMIHVVDSGHDVGISPDGPIGPRYSFQRGAVVLARKTNAVILMTSANASSAIRLPNWDRHFLPLPFSTVTIRVKYLPSYQSLDCPDDETGARVLRDMMMSITED